MTDERITPSFWLSEFLRSDTATRRGIDNRPKASELANIRNILAPGMQQVRDILGLPVQITSGYRCPEVNAAIGGSKSSQHMEGLAADFVCPQLGSPRTVAQYLIEHAGARLQFDQLIWEGGWVHISFVAKNPRRQVLTAHFHGGKVSYTEGLLDRRVV